MYKTKLKLAAALAIVMVIGFSFTMATKITVKGSDTMVILSQKWAEIYMKKNPGTTIQVTGGGSGVGIAALINGSTDIANSSRPIKPAELEKIKAKYNFTFDYYFADATTLKTIERANPSIVILEKGTITQKVHHNDIDKLKL